MSTMTGGMSVISDVLVEGTSGQYIEVDLIDGSTGSAVNTGAITAIVGTLRSMDTGATIFNTVDMLAGTPRATYPGTAGRVRVTFTDADVVAAGTREVQRRLLTLRITHSGGNVFHCAVQFLLRNLRDA